MIADLLLVAGGLLGGALLTYSFLNWEQHNQDDTGSRHRHPTSRPDDDLPDWLNG